MYIFQDLVVSKEIISVDGITESVRSSCLPLDNLSSRIEATVFRMLLLRSSCVVK